MRFVVCVFFYPPRVCVCPAVLCVVYSIDAERIHTRVPRVCVNLERDEEEVEEDPEEETELRGK